MSLSLASPPVSMHVAPAVQGAEGRRRFVLVKRRFTLAYGGGERYGVNLARSLTAAGFDVTVVGSSIDDELRAEVEFVPVQTSHGTPRAKILSFAEQAAAAVRALRADAVLGLCLTPEADVLRVTSRIHPHWMRIRYPHPWRHALERMNPRHAALLELERRSYQDSSRVSAIIVQSQLDRRLLTSYHGVPESKTHVIPNGVDAEAFHPRLRSQGASLRRREWIGAADAPLIVYAANRDFRGKGLASLIEGFAQVPSRDVRLAVLGGDAPGPYRRLAARLGVAPRIHFLGRREDAARWYAAADLFALPTLYEPFPNAVLEAMACGTPALTTAQCGAADVITPETNGYVVSHGRASDEIGAALERYFSLSRDEQAAMGRRARDVAATRSLAQNAAAVADVLKLAAA